MPGSVNRSLKIWLSSGRLILPFTVVRGQKLVFGVISTSDEETYYHTFLDDDDHWGPVGIDLRRLESEASLHDVMKQANCVEITNPQTIDIEYASHIMLAELHQTIQRVRIANAIGGAVSMTSVQALYPDALRIVDVM